MQYKNHENVQLSNRHESVLVENVSINPRTKSKDLVKMLAEAGQTKRLITHRKISEICPTPT